MEGKNGGVIAKLLAGCFSTHQPPCVVTEERADAGIWNRCYIQRYGKENLG
jgi:hypothetical protein